MATNPNRPEYLGTIESTWGQSVADHVVRRYASYAERDADLADLLASGDLEGQIVNVNGTPSEYSHGQWVELRPVVCGSDTFTTDGGGNFTVPLPAHSGWYGIAANGADSTWIYLIVVNTTTGIPGTSRCQLQVRNAASPTAVMANTACKVSFVAHIYFDPIA